MSKNIKFDYRNHPIFGYRMSPEAKKALERKVEQLLKTLNKELEPTDSKYTKKEIFIKALNIGLKELEK